MKSIGSLIARIGDYFLSLSDRTRMQIVVLALVLLAAGGIVKLVRSVRALNEPLTPATPEEMIEPMRELFVSSGRQTKTANLDRLRTNQKLDSLSKIYPDLKSKNP